jgi:hypothetical protein
MMAKALEVLGGIATAPGATLTALTMNTGNSATVRSAPFDRRIRLLQMWADNQVAGILRVRSARMHDNVQGIRMRVVASEPEPLLPWAAPHALFPQDALTLEISGSTVAGDIETAGFLVVYDDLPGIAGRFIGPDELSKRGVNVVTVENALATGTAGGYSGEAALNASFDLLKQNVDYAFVGYQVDAECAIVRWRGSDTGNLGVGGPGHAERKALTADWFVQLSRAFGDALIPVFNAANRAAILVDASQDENGTDVNVQTILVELSPMR